MLTHTVNEGETLWQISKRYQVTLDSLIYMNPQIYDPNYILPGSEIFIPEKSRDPVARNNNQKKDHTVEHLYANNRWQEQQSHIPKQAKPMEEPDTPPYVYHPRTGENLNMIANKLNIDQKRLLKLNLHLSPYLTLKDSDTVFVPEKIPEQRKPQNAFYPTNPSNKQPFNRGRRIFPGNLKGRPASASASAPAQNNSICPHCGKRLPPG